jgi:hypothetical protein
MKHCSPVGRRNHGRPLKRLLDTWDRNGSTSSPTPWQIYDDDKYNQIKLVLWILIISFLLVTTEGSLPRRCSLKAPTMEAQIKKAYLTWEFEFDMTVVVAKIFNKKWLCKGPLIRRELKCSEEIHVFLTHWIRFPDSILLEAPHSFSRYSADIYSSHIHTCYLFILVSL